MSYPYIHKEKLDNGDRISVKVKSYDRNGSLYIYDVWIIPKGKRKEIYIKDTLTDEYSYRILSMVDREKALLRRYIEVATLEVLNNALEAAWMSIKPKPIELVDCIINKG